MSGRGNRPPVANKSGLNGPKSGPCANPINCECIGAIRDPETGAVTHLVFENPEGGQPIEAPLGATPDEIKALILECLAEETDANTTFSIVDGDLPETPVPPTVPTDDPEDTHKQYHNNGVSCWSSDGSTWVHDGDKPLEICCDVIWASSEDVTEPSGPPPNPNQPALAIDSTTNQITHYWDPAAGAWVALKSCCPVAPIIVPHTPAVIGEPDEAAIEAAATAAAAGQPPTTLIKVQVAPNDCEYVYRVEADGSLCLIEQPQMEYYQLLARAIGSNTPLSTVANNDDITPTVYATIPNKGCQSYEAIVFLTQHSEQHAYYESNSFGLNGFFSIDGGTSWTLGTHHLSSYDAVQVIQDKQNIGRRVVVPPGGLEICIVGRVFKSGGPFEATSFIGTPAINMHVWGGHNSC